MVSFFPFEMKVAEFDSININLVEGRFIIAMAEEIFVSGFPDCPKTLRNDLILENEVVKAFMLYDFPCVWPVWHLKAESSNESRLFC